MQPITFRSVDLPDPEGPGGRLSAGKMSIETFTKASTLVSPVPKCFDMLVTRTRGPAAARTISTTERSCGIDFEGCTYAESARYQTYSKYDGCQHCHIVMLEDNTARKKSLTVAMSSAPLPKPINPSASACCTIMPTMVRSGAPMSFRVAICFSFSIVIV